ncbi:MAG: two-component system cell cycle response regulator [Bradymonadia bacterium]|jgi:two-component system cell cycle response regulator
MSTSILVVEDNVANLRLITYLLSSCGYDVLQANDGLPALALLRTQVVDLVVCDVGLPVMDGHAVVAAVRADPQLRDLPIIAVSALAMVGDREKIMRSGFDGYISKPIVPEAFVDGIEIYLPAHTRVARVAVPPARPTPAAAPRTPQTKGVILVVDDISNNLRFLRSVFEPSGYRVLSAHTAEEALQLIRQFLPDLILSDLHLGDENDFDFIDAVKADPLMASIPFVFISSTTKKQSIARLARQHGATRFLFRPMGPDALLSEVHELMLSTGEAKPGVSQNLPSSSGKLL